ncbi:MAG: VIT and VWA domain-containing protein [Phycisphaerales bacterium]|nr:VIT and VWA domain-containing protein [Phycisphaerales bacterium]
MMRRILAVAAFVVALVMGVQGGWADGLIVVRNPTVTVPGHFSFAPLEVVYHKVACEIQDQVAITSVDQEFYNPNGGRPLEGEYIFPVPKDTRIDKFAMDIDGKTMEAELLPAEKARQIYEDIVRASRDPALLEYAGQAMFRVRIFPIEPNGRKRVQLKYTQLLKQDNGLLDYHYTLNTEKFSSKPLQNVSMRVNIKTSEPITTVYSPTHEVEVIRHGDLSATAGFEAKNVRPDTDFHLFIGRKATAVGISLLTYRPDEGQDGYFVMMAAPVVSKVAKVMPKDVVFVMDTSGSMSGTKIEQARKALKYCVETLNPQDRFEIVRFSTEAEPFFGGLKEATEENRKKGADFAMEMRAAGGTAIDEAMRKALEARPKKDDDRLFLIVFMTDGQPTIGEQNPDRILKNVKNASGGAQVRVFSFGVGTDVNTKLLDVMAEETRGYSQYVLPNENLELTMSNFWGKVQDPVLAGLKMDTGSVTVSKVYPKELPDLFKGDQVVVFGTYTKGAKGAVTITGKVGGEVQTFAQDVVFEDKTDSSREWIARLWATRRVGYLLDEIQRNGESKELKDEVVALARRWGVVTPYTAMLIIEDERRRNVPVAVRSLREMEGDRVAFANAATELHAIRTQEVTGGQSVARSVGNRASMQAKNLEVAQDAAKQSSDRYRDADEKNRSAAESLAKVDAPMAPSAAPESNMPAMTRRLALGGGMGGGGVGVDGSVVSGPGIREQPIAGKPMELEGKLNLGRSTLSGWQTVRQAQQSQGQIISNDKEQVQVAQNTQGYRVVTNYAQQSRVINSRAFFLNGNQWTDSRTQNAKPESHIKVVFGSTDYFDLLKKHPDAAQYFALGNNVTVELDGKIYDIVEEEAMAPAVLPGK